MEPEMTFASDPNAGLFTLTSAAPSTIVIYDHNEMIVELNTKTGEVKFGNNYTFDKASTVFWQCLGLSCPTIRPEFKKRSFAEYDNAMKGLL